MATTQKALDLYKTITSNLKQRLPALAVAETYDVDGSPVITLGTGTAGTQTIVLKVMPAANINKDIIGLAQQTYGGSVVQIALETSTIAGVPLLTAANLVPALGEACATGATVQLYLSANTTAPTTATLVAANLKATFDLSLQYGFNSAS